MRLPVLTGELTGMHDGVLLSVSVGEGSAVLKLVHVDGRKFSLNLQGVEGLLLNEFREGNIVSELQILSGSEFEEARVSKAGVREIFEAIFTRPHPAAAQEYQVAFDASLDECAKRLEDGSMRLVILEPAYGADLVAFCASADLVPMTA